MDLNEIKKSLYKQNPSASLVNITKDGVYYKTSLERGELVQFFIPFHEIPEFGLGVAEPAKYLIRYIVLND